MNDVEESVDAEAINFSKEQLDTLKDIKKHAEIYLKQNKKEWVLIAPDDVYLLELCSLLIRDGKSMMKTIDTLLAQRQNLEAELLKYGHQRQR